MAASDYIDEVQEIFVAYYGRPADPSGLDYWTNQVDAAGGDLTAIIDDFGNSAEFTGRFGTMTDEELITNLFQQMFNRDPDADGLAFYIDRLNGTNASGLNDSLQQSSLGVIALQIADGAQNEDATALTNKVTVATSFTDALTASGATYSGNDDANEAAAVIAGVTDDAATVTAAAAATDSYMGNNGGTVTYTLTQDAASGLAAEGTSVTYTVTGPALAADADFTYVVGGAAVTGADFTGATSGAVSIAAGETSTTFSVALAANDGTELAETYTVTLSQGGSAVATINTTIQDAEVDVIAPEVAADQTFVNPENMAADAALGTVSATDAVGVTSFAITGGNDDGFFQVSDAGVISLTEDGAASAANDFETTPNEAVVQVTASDAAGNASAAVDVTLNVSDVDDIAPTVTTAVIDGDSATLNFSEPLDASLASPGTADFNVTIKGGAGDIAVSAVKVIGSTVELTLGRAPAAGETFEVDYVPGVNPLQDAAGNAVAAFDDEELVADTTAPVITAGQAFTYVEETLDLAGDTVGTVAATDAIGSIAGFSIVSGNTEGYFAIDGAGKLTLTAAGVAATAASFDFETTPNAFTLGIQATDGAGNTGTGNVAVTVTNDPADDADQPLELPMTAQTDALEGGSGDDTVIGDSGDINAADVVDGNGGVDTARLALDGNGLGGNPLDNNEIFTSREVEIFELQALGNAGNTLQFTNTTGVEKIISDNSTGNLVAADVRQMVTLGAEGGNGSNFTTQFRNGVASGTLDVELNGATVGNFAAGDTNGTVDFSGLQISSTGGASTITDIGDGTGANFGVNNALSTVTVTGDQQLTVANELENVTTFTATNFSGGLLVVLDDAAGRNVTFSGGSGNDRVDVQAANLTANDMLDGSTGSDTLRIGDGNMLTAVNAANVQGFEVLETTNGGAEVFNVDALIANNPLTDILIAGAGNTTVNNINDGALNNSINIVSDAIGTVTLTAKNFTSGGSTDEATINLDNDVVDNANGVDITTLNFANVDKLNLNSVMSATAGNQENSVASLVAPDLETVIVGGNNDVSLGTANGTASVTEVDARNLTQSLWLNVSQDTTQGGVLVRGGSDNDTVIGTGNGTTAGDTFVLGAGSDSVNVDSNGGQADVFSYTATSLDSGDVAANTQETIGGFRGNSEDSIDFTGGVEGALQFQGQNLAGANANVILTNAVTLGNNTNVAAIDNGNDLQLQFDLNGNGQYDQTGDFLVTLLGLAGSNITYNAVNDNFVITTNVFGTMNLVGSQNNDILVGDAQADTLTGNGGNDTLTGNGGNDTFNVNSGTDTITDLATGDILVVSAGATANANNVAAFVATAASSNAGTATLNSVAAGSNIDVSNAGGANGFTLAGGAGVDTLTGGGNVDTLTGGAGADILFGNAGNDTLNGGADNDTVTGGAGADAIDVGTGNDDVTYSADGDAGVAGTLAQAQGDTVSNFTTTADTISFIGDYLFGSMTGTVQDGTNAIANAGNVDLNGAGTGDDNVQIITGAAGNTAALADLFDIADLNAAIGNVTNGVVGDERILIFNSFDGNNAVAYKFTSADAVDNAIVAAELQVLGTFDNNIAAGDISFA